MDQKDIEQKEREITIARLQMISKDLHFSDGNSDNNYSRDEMIKLIAEGDKVGIEFVKTEWEFLRAYKDGILAKTVTN